KRVRVYFGGEVVADTIAPVLVWEGPHYPVYYLPADDVRLDLLAADGAVRRSSSRGDGQLYTVKAGGREAPGAAVRFPDSPMPELRELVRFEFAAMDAWFEEDEEIFVHPRDPHTR